MRNLVGIAHPSKCFLPHCDIVLGFLTFVTSANVKPVLKNLSARVNNINAEQQLIRSKYNKTNTVRKCEKPSTLFMTTLKENFGM